MKHLFVPYDIALMAKGKGFNEDCITRWGETSKKLYETWKPMKNSEDCEDFTTAPLYQQLIDWFEEKHNIFIEVRKLNDNKWCYQIHGPSKFDLIHIPSIISKYESYHRAFFEAFKLIK